jgi:hypothetical protein
MNRFSRQIDENRTNVPLDTRGNMCYSSCQEEGTPLARILSPPIAARLLRKGLVAWRFREKCE